MADFADTLLSVIDRNHLYLTTIAAAGGVDRSIVTKVTKRERSFSMHTFKRILENLNIPSEDRNLLFQSYIEEKYGYSKYLEHMKVLLNFSNFDDSAIMESTSHNNIKIELKDSIMELNSKTEIVNIMHCIVSLEVDKGKDGRVYSNAPSETVSETMRFFPDKPIDFKYIINNFIYEKDRFMSFSNVFNLMHSGYNCNYYSSATQQLHLNLVFPYYVITSEYLLVFDFYNNTGILSANKVVVEKYKKAFLTNFEGTLPYINRMENIMDLKEINLDALSKGVSKANFLHDFGCYSTQFLDLDMWDQIAKPDVPNRDFLRDTTYQYYQHAYGSINKNLCTVSSKESLAEFVDYGIVSSMPREFAFPLTKENRIKILQKMYDFYASTNSLLFYLFDNSKLKLGKNFGYEVIENTSNTSHVSMYYLSENCKLTYCGNLNFASDDPETVNEFSNLLDCFILSDYCYSNEKSLEILKEEILRCQMLPD